jgi:hypothetical protein
MARNRLIDDEEYDRLMFAFGQAAEEDEAAGDAQAQYDGAYTTPGRDDHAYFNAYRTPQRPSPSPKCVCSTHSNPMPPAPSRPHWWGKAEASSCLNDRTVVFTSLLQLAHALSCEAPYALLQQRVCHPCPVHGHGE